MLTTLSLKFENENKIEEIFEYIKNILSSLGECGTLAANLEIRDKEIYSQGIPLIENNDISSMFNETYALLFVEFIMSEFPGEKFMISLEIEGLSSSIIHVLNDESAGYFYSDFDEDTEGPEYAFFIGEEHEINDDEWEPIYYDDKDEFIFDYFMTFRGKDLSFFNDSKLSQLFADVNLDELEEKYKEFDAFLNRLQEGQER